MSDLACASRTFWDLPLVLQIVVGVLGVLVIVNLIRVTWKYSP